MIHLALLIVSFVVCLLAFNVVCFLLIQLIRLGWFLLGSPGGTDPQTGKANSCGPAFCIIAFVVMFGWVLLH